MRRLLAALSAALLIPVLAGTPAHATSGPFVAVFGDSIAAGDWLANPASESWVARLAAANPGATFRNYAVGGMALHQTDTYQQQLLDHVKDVAAGWKAVEDPVPATVILEIGTNDVMGHTLEAPPWSGQALYYSEWAATNVQAYLTSLGVRRVLWNTVPPWAASSPSSAHPGYVLPQWVGPLMWRTSSFNTWLAAMYGANVVNTGWTLMDWQCWCMGDTREYVDGFHPNADGHARIAWAFSRAVTF